MERNLQQNSRVTGPFQSDSKFKETLNNNIG